MCKNKIRIEYGGTKDKPRWPFKTKDILTMRLRVLKIAKLKSLERETTINISLCNHCKGIIGFSDLM